MQIVLKSSQTPFCFYFFSHLMKVIDIDIYRPNNAITLIRMISYAIKYLLFVHLIKLNELVKDKYIIY